MYYNIQFWGKPARRTRTAPVNDRRIAENTARVPLADAPEFITMASR